MMNKEILCELKHCGFYWIFVLNKNFNFTVRNESYNHPVNFAISCEAKETVWVRSSGILG